MGVNGGVTLKETMRAYVVSQDGDEVNGAVTTLATDQLPAGDVTIEVEYSSLNYKDGLACIPKGGIVRTYPHIPGIDAAGHVVESQSASLAVGDRVLITGYDLGVAHWGGYAEYVRVPAEWVVKTPDGLSNFEAMALGTAGFTAAMCLLVMERNGLHPGAGTGRGDRGHWRRGQRGGQYLGAKGLYGRGEYGQGRSTRLSARSRGQRNFEP